MTFELLMAIVMIAFNGCVLDGPIHSLDLAIGPGMLDLGEPVLNAMFKANPIKDMLEGEALLLLIGKLNAVVRQHNMNGIGNGSNEITQKLRGQHFTCLRMNFDVDKLAGSINGNKEIELALGRLYFGNVDMEIANGV